MSECDTKDFFKWLEKSKATEADVINCRKMQSVSFTESENIYGITTISVCGFINNDVVKLGGEIRQQYDEKKGDYYDRVYRILFVCSELMDAVNGILVDEGSWGKDYFQVKLKEWREKKRLLVK